MMACESPGTCACGCFECGGEEHCERHHRACHLACVPAAALRRLPVFAEIVPVRDGLL